MKIAVYSPTFPPVIDGTSIQAERLANLLSAHYETHVLTFAVDRDIRQASAPRQERAERLDPNYVEIGKFPLLSPEKIERRIDEIRPDVIHIRGWYQFPVARGVIRKGFELGSRLFWYTDGIRECHENFAGTESYACTVEEAKMNGVSFITQSTMEKDILETLGISATHISVVPPLIPEFPERPPISYERVRMLSVGRLYGYKGHTAVFDAVKAVAPYAELVLAGACDTEEGRELARTLLRKGASMVLNPSASLLEELYVSSTHYVSGSRRETLGIATLEAVGAGCIPLARKIGGIADYLEEYFLFSSDEEMESKLRLLVEESPGGALEKLRELKKKISRRRVGKLLMRMQEEGSA